MPKATRLAGIVAVGGSHAQAVENFRKTATGQNAMFYLSESGVAYASQSSVDLFDPHGSNKLLEENAELVAQAEFQSESSSSNVKADYHICLDGCGSHIVSDSSANVTHCPSCSASLEEVSDDRILDHMESENAESVSRNSVVAVGATLDEAKTNLANAIRTQDLVTALSSATSFVAMNDGVRFDPYSSLPISESKTIEAEEIQALSCDNGKLEAHVYSCSASCAAPFTIATDDDTVFCAHCSAPLIDIASESSDEDDASDIIEEEEDLDDDTGLDDDEEELDEEDSESSTSSDDDEEDEEEDEFDDEEEDDEDFGDEDDEDDDEEFDDEELESESSSDDDEFDDEFDDAEEFEDEEDDEDEDDDFDDEEDEEIESESSVRSLTNSEVESEVRSFDSLSAVKAEHANLDPNLVSLSRSANGRIPTVHMFFDGVPVASSTFSSYSAAAGEDSARRVFDREDFIRAVSKSLHNNGVEETCKAFGFQPFVMQLSVSKVLAAKAEEQIESASAAVNSTVADAISTHRERFVAALSTSMLGITRNFWRDSNNPVVESLCATLRSAGVADPRPLVERAFINNGEDLLRASLSQADALMTKSEVAQNEIAEAVAQSAGVVRTDKSTPKVPSVSNDREESLDESVESESSAKRSGSSFDERLKRRFGR